VPQLGSLILADCLGAHGRIRIDLRQHHRKKALVVIAQRGSLMVALCFQKGDEHVQYASLVGYSFTANACNVSVGTTSGAKDGQGESRTR
jgi:hypothetical protein